jgi:mRNA interferase ChpB
VAGFTVDLIGTKTVGVVRCDQPRVLDLVARKAKKLERVSTDVMDDVLAKLATLVL